MSDNSKKEPKNKCTPPPPLPEAAVGIFWLVFVIVVFIGIIIEIVNN